MHANIKGQLGRSIVVGRGLYVPRALRQSDTS